MFTVKTNAKQMGWIAEVTDLPGAMAYGAAREEAVARAEALALRIIADRLERGETVASSFRAQRGIPSLEGR